MPRPILAVNHWASIRFGLANSCWVWTWHAFMPPSRIWAGSSTEFEAELLDRRIELINSKPYHPQTNCKLERFHRSVEEEMKHWDTLSEYVTYYNERRLRVSLDINNHQTSLKVFSNKRSLETINRPNWIEKDVNNGAKWFQYDTGNILVTQNRCKI